MVSRQQQQAPLRQRRPKVMARGAHCLQAVAALPGVRELHIGHAIVSRSVFIGMREAVRDMKRLMREAAAAGQAAG